VRGRVVGAECLSSVVEDPPPEPPPLPPAVRRGDLITLVGFGIVVAASAFPWRRSAVATTGFGDAWTLRWSLLAAVAGAIGLAAAVAGWRRLIKPALAATIYAICAVLVALGTVLDVARPPTLSSVARTIPWRLALLGACIALAGAAVTAFAARSRAGHT
jgi:hypothetical protein